jgi:pyruvate/2-oxoglutarate dehydrogenase complex dihydrolipoamide dehydrogenase (E3) component
MATKPKQFDRNLIVIGAGSAGLVSAYIAAMVQAKVTLIEAREMGGDCLNTGCVPSKALIKSARVAHLVSDAARFGVKTSAPTIDFPKVMRRIRDVITAIEPHDSVERFTNLGVDCVRGYARFIDPWTVEIDGKTRLTAQNFIIATGAAPLVPPLPGVEASGYLTSETLWDEFAKRSAAPQRLIILGGGPIGCELAQSFQRLGSQVTLIEMAERLLLKEEADAATIVTQRLHADGVEILTGHKAVRFEKDKCLIVEGTRGERPLAYDDVLIAVGRKPRISGFGLEELGLVIDGKLPVDGFLRTNIPHILCAGDVAGKQQLTHGGSHEAWYASVNALARPFKKYRADYRVLPRVTYTEPELAAVGLTEADATQLGIAFDVTRYDLDDLDRAIAEGERTGFVKILTAAGSDRILGATVIGEHAGEILAEITFAMKHQMGLRKILATIHPYPTWSEATKYAAGQFSLARKPLGLLKWAERWFRWRRG